MASIREVLPGFTSPRGFCRVGIRLALERLGEASLVRNPLQLINNILEQLCNGSMFKAVTCKVIQLHLSCNLLVVIDCNSPDG